MNTTSFMDKQIMDLTHSSSSSAHNKDLIDLINQNHNNLNHPDNHKEEHELEEERVRGGEEEEETLNLNGITKDDIVPSYDFQPIRPHTTTVAASSNYDSAPNFGAAFSRSWNSDSNAGSSPPPPHPIIKSYSSLDTIETAKVMDKDRKAFDATILSEIDRTVKNHMENLFHVMEGVSARLTQLESRTHRLENSVDDLKVSVGNNLGITDGKLRQIENILHEVQTGVQVIKDKQDTVGAQLQLAKLQVSNTAQPSETQTSVITDPVQQAASAPQQSQQQLPSHVHLPQSIPAVPPPNAPPQPPPQQGLPPSVQHLNQFPQNQIPAAPQRDPYFQPLPQQHVQSQEAPNQQYQLPLTQQPHPQPGAPPSQQYQQASNPQYPQPAPHLPQQQPPHSPVNLPQHQPSLGHHVEETPYAPSQNYPPNLRQPTSQPPSGPPPSQQYYSVPPHAYEPPPSSRPGSGYSSGYGTISGPTEPYRYGGSSQYGVPSTQKPTQLPTASSVAPSAGSGYPQLPTARLLPQALPTASAATGSSGSAGTGSRVPIDDVVDKVASMGFSRDQVRGTVRRLAENGQSVDLNTVLDKLMNEGDGQPSRGWFGAR